VAGASSFTATILQSLTPSPIADPIEDLEQIGTRQNTQEYWCIAQPANREREPQVELKRLGRPQEIANVCAFLATDEAS
jgi:NAD(P)-dependent dehydrogenase (short-subunit alcohol dehydrogenase family)